MDAVRQNGRIPQMETRTLRRNQMNVFLGKMEVLRMDLNDLKDQDKELMLDVVKKGSPWRNAKRGMM
ncbi:unnamed protein product [Caretta caretta]